MFKYRIDFQMGTQAFFAEVMANDDLHARGIIMVSYPRAQYLKIALVDNPKVYPKLATVVDTSNIIKVDFKNRKRVA